MFSARESEEIRLRIQAMTPEELHRVRLKNLSTTADQMKATNPKYYEEGLKYLYTPLNQPGGFMGMRWTPSCGPYTTINRGWLDLIYWDIQTPFGPPGAQRRTFNVQACVAGTLPQEPFDYVTEGVKVRYLDTMRQRAVRVRAEDNPEAYIAFGGDIFVVTFPRERGRFNDCVTENLQFPL
ncbi:hypothetical protein DFH06DRAFT_1293285 [Mycena polygramma]|nr:hypothetical protein DFH06DRAFT_1293285 [Mycena polygramma]